MSVPIDCPECAEPLEKTSIAMYWCSCCYQEYDADYVFGWSEDKKGCIVCGLVSRFVVTLSRYYKSKTEGVNVRLDWPVCIEHIQQAEDHVVDGLDIVKKVEASGFERVMEE